MCGGLYGTLANEHNLNTCFLYDIFAYTNQNNQNGPPLMDEEMDVEMPFSTSIFINSVPIFYSHLTISNISIFMCLIKTFFFFNLKNHNFQQTLFCQLVIMRADWGLNQNLNCFSGKKSSHKCFTNRPNVSHRMDSVFSNISRSLLVSMVI